MQLVGGGVLVELCGFSTGPFFGFRRIVRGWLFVRHRGKKETELRKDRHSGTQSTRWAMLTLRSVAD